MPNSFRFGHVIIKKSQIFHTTKTTFACVNISPIVPGHILICPKREVKRYHDLTDNEISEMFISARKIGSTLEKHFNRTALTFGLQDGVDSGQSVEHVHLHVLPRIKGDFERKEDIYRELRDDRKAMERGERKLRSIEEMAEEADIFRKLLIQE